MMALWVSLAVFLAAALGLALGLWLGRQVHADTCHQLQDDAYDQGWDASVLHRTGLLRATSWADTGRTSEATQQAASWLASARAWARRQPAGRSAVPPAGREFPADYCLADQAGYGACVLDPGHGHLHRDANGHTWADGPDAWHQGTLAPGPAGPGEQPAVRVPWPECSVCGGGLMYDAAGVYCPLGCPGDQLAPGVAPDATQAPPQATRGACHSCADTDAGLICQTQLGGVCPGLAASSASAQDAPGRHAGARRWRSPVAMLRHAGTRA